MAIRKRTGKRGVTWQIDYTDPNGKRVRQTFKLKKDAVNELAKRVSLIGEGRYLDVKPECTTRLGELIDKYIENFGHKQRSFYRNKIHFLDNFRKYFGEDRILSAIRYVDLETYRNHLMKKPTMFDGQRSDATVNREMACLRHLLRKAMDWDMIEQSPFYAKESLILKENNERTRYLSQDEIDSLLKACFRQYLSDVVTTALHTGMRKSEILSLRWDQIKDGLIYLTKTKTDNPRQIPIDDDLDALFRTIRKRNQLRSEYVFVREDGSRIRAMHDAFAMALKRAHIEDFRFHDLRHTFASHFLMRGGHLRTLQKVLGHKKIEMTMRYSHLSQEFTREEIQNMKGLTGQVSQENVTKCDVHSFQTVHSVQGV